MKLLLCAICMFLIHTLSSQTTFGNQNLITNEVDDPFSVISADLDLSGTIDIISASGSDNKIAWYENLAYGEFGPQNIISNTVEGANCLYTADLDGDNDLDILATARNASEVMWFENMGGGSFGSKILIDDAVGWPCAVYAADLDGDSDQDVISCAFYGGEITWYENDASGNFSSPIEISTNQGQNSALFVADLDGDIDIDVIGGDYSNGILFWHRNGGNGTFSYHNIISENIGGPRSIYAIDLDGDTDKDIILSTSSTLSWFENDGFGNFGEQIIINNDLDDSQSLVSCDIEIDGDNDLILIQYDEVWLFENNGNGIFSIPYVVTDDIYDGNSVFTDDLDNDGDFDLMSASNDKIAWYENHYININDTVVLCDGDSILIGNDWHSTAGIVISDSLLNSRMGDSLIATLVYIQEAPPPFQISGPNLVQPNTIHTYMVPVNESLDYEWIVDFGEVIDTLSPNAVSISYEEEGSGFISVIAENKITGCIRTDSMQVMAGFNSIYNYGSSYVSIYPNPASNKLYIGNSPKSFELILRDMKGSLVLKTNHSELDISKLISGAYTAKIYNDKRKLIKSEILIVE